MSRQDHKSNRHRQYVVVRQKFDFKQRQRINDVLGWVEEQPELAASWIIWLESLSSELEDRLGELTEKGSEHG